MKINKVIFEGEYTVASDIGDAEFSTIAYSKDNIGEKCLYFHLKGVNFNTDSLEEAILARSPVAIIADEDSALEADNIPVLRVKNARRALSEALARFFGIDFSRLKFVGVTGTNGKTTTAYMLKKILEEDGRRVGYIGTGQIVSDGKRLTDDNYSMTTPDPDLLYSSVKRMENDGCEYIIMEVSSHSIALEKIAPIRFELALFTNLSHEHLDFHGTVEEYYKTKLRLFDTSKHGIFNIDDAYGRRGFSECGISKESVGILFDADACAREPRLFGFDGSSYLYRAKDFLFRMNLPLVGAYNIYNSLMAICAAVRLGVRPCVARRALEEMRSPDGRFEIYRRDVTVIVDYAHTPRAFENVLKTINSCKNTEQKLITVFGCGGDRDKSKRPVMGKVAEELSDVIVITEDNSRSEDKESIAKDILVGIKDKSKAALILSRAEAIRTAILTAAKGDVIAVLGKGAERYNIDRDGIHPFSERSVIESALEERQGN